MHYTTSISFLLFAFSWIESYALEGVEEITTPKPYAFSYSAGRMPGHIDRVHNEVSDGLGVVRGMYSYVDPRQQIRTVEYVADRNGFHPLLITNPTLDTTAVQTAKAKHHALFQEIAAEHERIAYERNPNGEADEDEYHDSSDTFDPSLLISHPRDTPVVERAKLRHYDLYNKIALEHAKIAAERFNYNNAETHEATNESQENVVKIGFVNY